MRSLFLAGAFALAASAALADTRVFIIANQADGYGVDQCLAKGDKCGAHAARSYCQSREFAQAPPIAASIPTKSPAQFPAATATNAQATVAANTSPSPASARDVYPAVSRAGLPH